MLLLVACGTSARTDAAAEPRATVHCTSHFIRVVVDSKQYQLVCTLHGAARDVTYQLTGTTLPHQGPVLRFTWCAGALVNGAATCRARFTIIVPFAPTALLVTARFAPSQDALQVTIPLNG